MRKRKTDELQSPTSEAKTPGQEAKKLKTEPASPVQEVCRIDSVPFIRYLDGP